MSFLLGFDRGGYWAVVFVSRVVSRLFGESPESRDRKAVNLGRILTNQNAGLKSSNLEDYGFGVFSQWDEDGIIQELTRTVPQEAQTFIEIGVEDYSESNTRFLLFKDNWVGAVIDGSKRNVRKIKSSYYYWRHTLTATAIFVTAENASDLVKRTGLSGNLGLLSIDVDGVDLHVLRALSWCRPHVLVCEYNAVFGSQESVTVPYRADFNRTRAHYSNLYFGASLTALTEVAQEMDMVLVGTNCAGNNAFFVRRESVGSELPAVSVAQAFKEASFRESRDRRGRLSFEVDNRRSLIDHLPLDKITGV